MGKTPKKAISGGDERNLYVRRLKATTAPSKSSESSLPERQHDSESANRYKLIAIQKKIPSSGKGLKNKSRVPVKVGLNNPSKRSSKLPVIIPEDRNTADSLESTLGTASSMQTEPERDDFIFGVPIPKEIQKEEDIPIKRKDQDILDKNQENPCEDHDNVPILEKQAELKVPENTSELKTDQNISTESTSQNSANELKESEEHEDTDIKLTFEDEEPPSKSEAEAAQEKQLNDEEKLEELHRLVQSDQKTGSNEKEDVHSEAPTDSESYSVDIVESTTSEISETLESVTQADSQKEKGKEKPGNNDASFVSYDTSIMLKDVQIKLNDCLKDNSKLFDTSDAGHSTPNPPKDMSFGKTLRNISGRHSLNRMRHITGREYRLSPNNSLFVNTSSLSLPQDESLDCKILHYSSGISDALPTNGSPLDKKRRLEAESWSSAKKQKTESENSLLNTSLSYLEKFRRIPIQVSTPNVGGYKFQSDKLRISGINNKDDKILVDEAEGTRKWCVLM